MLYLSLTAQRIAVYLIAALAPAVFLMHYIWKSDKAEKEPGSLLRACFLRGALAVIPAFLLEMLTDNIILPLTPVQTQMTYGIINALFVGIIEEGCKFFFLKKRTWNDPNFNYRFDGIVYAVFVSLGFAAVENIMYVFNYGLSVALSRAVLSVPGHMGFSVLLGMFYSRAKICDIHGDRSGRKLNLLAGYLLAVTMHAFFDGSITVGTDSAMIAFVIFVIVMYILIYRTIRKESLTDRPIV